MTVYTQIVQPTPASLLSFSHPAIRAFSTRSSLESLACSSPAASGYTFTSPAISVTDGTRAPLHRTCNLLFIYSGCELFLFFVIFLFVDDSDDVTETGRGRSLKHLKPDALVSPSHFLCSTHTHTLCIISNLFANRLMLVQLNSLPLKLQYPGCIARSSLHVSLARCFVHHMILVI